MMAKISQGGSFGGAIGYVLNRDEAYIMKLRGIKDGEIKEMAHSFEIQAQLNPIAKPVAHISINFSAEDRANLTDEKMGRIAVEYMEEMGYGNTQFLMVRHTDRGHPHLHLILNRVDFDGKRVSDQNERIRNIKVTQELTRKHGLFISKGKDNVKRRRLRGYDNAKYRIYDSLNQAIPKCKSWRELEQRLRVDGIGVEYKTKGATAQIEGVRFSNNGYTFNGSKIDRQFSYSKIDFALRHNAHMEQQATIQHHDSQQIDESNIGSAIGAIFDMPYTPDTDDELIPTPPKKKLKRKIRF